MSNTILLYGLLLIVKAINYEVVTSQGIYSATIMFIIALLTDIARAVFHLSKKEQSE